VQITPAGGPVFKRLCKTQSAGFNKDVASIDTIERVLNALLADQRSSEKSH
jgi:hypothetical protein